MKLNLPQKWLVTIGFAVDLWYALLDRLRQSLRKFPTLSTVFRATPHIRLEMQHGLH